MSAVEIAASPINMTDAAAAHVRELVEGEENPSLALRVYVTGGGCSGFQYGFSFDEKVADSDKVIEKDGARLVVDSKSYTLLAGSLVDFVDDLNGAKFVVSNPNADSTCGCGTSFSASPADSGCNGCD